MSTEIQWFTQTPMHIQIGRCFTLGSPKGEWQIDEIHNEHSFQRDRSYDSGQQDDAKKRPSCASLSLSCHNVQDNTPAMMRVYMQIPDLNTEHESSSDRARQARKYTPRELRAFKAFEKKRSTYTPRLLGYWEDSQVDNSPVPGGFVAALAWEIVPGVRLGDDSGEATTFWTFDKSERDLIRIAFEKALKDITSMGFIPYDAGPENLVWDFINKRLYWVGFRYCGEIKPQKSLSASWFPSFDLVKVPRGDHTWVNPNCDKSGWKW